MKKKTSTPKKQGRIVTKKKAAETIKSTGSYIAENKKELLYLGGAILLVYVGYKAYKGISKATETVGDILENPETDFIKVDLSVDNRNLTITEEDAKVMAKSLLDAFNETILFGSPSADTEKIEKVFDTLQTGDDFRLVYKAFGKRKRYGGGTPTYYLSKKLASEYDLTHWLKQEVSSFLYSDLYKKIEARLKSANIPF